MKATRNWTTVAWWTAGFLCLGLAIGATIGLIEGPSKAESRAAGETVQRDDGDEPAIASAKAWTERRRRISRETLHCIRNGGRIYDCNKMAELHEDAGEHWQH